MSFLMYEMGSSVNQNDQKAFEWYQKAASQRYHPAEYRLGIFYDQGVIGAKNKRIAQLWMERAASDGSEDAKNYLEQMK